MNNDGNTFNRHPFFWVFLFLLFTIGLVLGLMETGLRYFGYVPGSLTEDPYLNLQDSIFLYDDYDTDSLGIVKVSKESTQLVNQYVSNHQDTIDRDVLSEAGVEWSLIEVAQDFASTIYSKHEKNSFGLFVDELTVMDTATTDQVDKAYIHYATNPINKEGFRSLDFIKYKSEKTSVFLIGDSFTWGLSAEPITNSFSDLLASMGYLVYNAGIISTEPAQYEAIARKYLPKLEPDHLIVSYFLGNDDMFYHREPVNGQLIFHPSNAGWIWAHPRGRYLNFEEAYQYALDQCYIPNKESNALNRYLSKTVIGTLIWKFMRKQEIEIDEGHLNKEFSVSDASLKEEKNISPEYLAKIKSICDKKGVAFHLVLIPEIDELEKNSAELEEYESFALPYYTVPGLTAEDYNPKPDGHFNNRGMKKYAEYLESIILMD